MKSNAECCVGSCCSQTLRTYAEEASKVTTDQFLNLFMPEVTPDEIQCRVLRRLMLP